MKARFLIAAMMAGMMAVCVAACSDNDADDPTDPDVPPTPPTEQVEPLTDELRPILTEGKRWIVEGGRVSSTKTQFVCEITQNVIAEGFSAKEITKTGVNNGTDEFRTILREENGMLFRLCQTKAPQYVVAPESVYEYILTCNITPNASETFDCYGYNSIIISRGTIVLQGKTRRAVKVWSDGRFFVDYPDVDPYDYWVEGIGSLYGQMPYGYWVIPTTPTYNYMDRYRLLECYDGDEKIYDYREFTPELYTEEEVFTDIDKLTQD